MSSIVIAGNTSGSVTLSAPAVSGSSVLTLPASTDTLVGKATTDTLTNKTLTAPVLSGSLTGTYTLSGTPTTGASLITSGTAQASTSGTSIDFTSIPSWVKRITVMFNGVSTNSTSPLQIQLGTSAGAVTTGYNVINSVMATGVSTISFSAGFGLTYSTTYTFAANTHQANIVFTLMGSNIWTGTGITGTVSSLLMFPVVGSVTLPSTLDRVRITTVNGTDTFDAGSINILYE